MRPDGWSAASAGDIRAFAARRCIIPEQTGSQSVYLPGRGVRSSSRMVAVDRDGAEEAALVQDWLAAKGLRRSRRGAAP